jgi:hypothetical protein
MTLLCTSEIVMIEALVVDRIHQGSEIIIKDDTLQACESGRVWHCDYAQMLITSCQHEFHVVQDAGGTCCVACDAALEASA